MDIWKSGGLSVSDMYQEIKTVEDMVRVAHSEYPILAEHDIKSSREFLRFLIRCEDNETIEAVKNAWLEHTDRLEDAEILFIS